MDRSRIAKIAILFISSIVILYFGGVYLKGLALFSKHNYYYIELDDANGLKEGSQIFYKGVKVGSITGIKLNTENKISIKIECSIDSSLQLTDKAHIKAVGAVLGLGGAYLTILISQEGRPLKSGDYIKASLDIGLSEKLSPTIKNVEDLVFATNNLLAEIAKNTENISQIFINLETITSKLGSILTNNERSIEKISRNLSVLINDLVDEAKGLPALIKKINKIVDDYQEAGLTVGFMSNLNKLAESLETVSEKILNVDNSIGKLLSNDEIYQNFNKLISSHIDLTTDIKENPGRYIHFSVFGKK